MVSWTWDLSALPLLLLSLLLHWPPAHPPLCLPRTSALHTYHNLMCQLPKNQLMPIPPDSGLGLVGLRLTRFCTSHEILPAQTAASFAPL